ncbi:FHA domain-containing protein [Nocardia sp. NPDC057353]|uniref:FHA domain-containing protein n=1 Tax=Nocardia sp. NPDC057353 TaxID=3346104 RepID=UPI003631565F
MRDRQVEVVAGQHAVARVAGAVVVVRHRGVAAPAPDSPTAAAVESLAELVREAFEREAGPGAMIAREATRWLMKHAEQISPGQPVDFGILSVGADGGVAVFLHGAVTAVLVGEAGVEQLRGSDAAFTVDRVAPVPARAAALFVDDRNGRIPELPAERGIGWLVEGIALGAGAILWSDAVRAGSAPPSSGDQGASDPSGAHRRAEPSPIPTARIERAPRRERAEPRNAQVQRRERAEPEDEQAQRREQAEPRDETEAAATALLDQVEATDALPAVGTGARAVTMPPDPHRAPTEHGTNPAPPPDPELQRRLEATARAAPLNVKVMGFKCARAHPTDPRSAFCTVCGMPVDQTQPLIEVIRPPLGLLLLDDGMTYLLAADAVIGRDPDHSESVNRGMVPLKVEDSSGGMSRAHAEIRLLNWDVAVLDLGSTNGTRTRMPGYRDWLRLAPHQPMLLVPGAEVMIGNRVLRFEPAAPPPFGR